MDFAALQSRARRRGRSAEEAAVADPAYLITFDVPESDGTNLMSLPYRDRRARLESLFATGVLNAPFTLCPATADRATAQDWLNPAWGNAGIEGVVLKGLNQPYLPRKRAWIKVRARVTAEALIGGVTGSPTGPLSLLLGRYDASDDLRLVARTTSLAASVRRELAEHLTPATPDHPWAGRRFSAAWGTRGELTYRPVKPELVAEFIADTALDAGRYRHPVRFMRIRTEMHPMQVPRFEKLGEKLGQEIRPYSG
ncbi:ATP-dependent DNA ligase [Streptomyces eurythermus]